MFVCCDCCVLSGRGLCNELITRPEESHRLWCVVVCDLETTKFLQNEGEAKAHWGAIAPRENIIIIVMMMMTMTTMKKKRKKKKKKNKKKKKKKTKKNNKRKKKKTKKTKKTKTKKKKKKKKKKKFFLVCKGLIPYYFELKKASNLRRTPLL